MRASDPSDTIPTKLSIQRHVQADLMELVSLQNIYKCGMPADSGTRSGITMTLFLA